MKEDTLNYDIKAPLIQGIFLIRGVLGSLGVNMWQQWKQEINALPWIAVA